MCRECQGHGFKVVNGEKLDGAGYTQSATCLQCEGFKMGKDDDYLEDYVQFLRKTMLKENNETILKKIKDKLT